MNEHCPVCGLQFEVEPGFFFVAMYVSYALSVALATTLGVMLYVLASDPPLLYYLLVIGGAILVSIPWLFRYARVLSLYLFAGIKYDPHFAK